MSETVWNAKLQVYSMFCGTWFAAGGRKGDFDPEISFRELVGNLTFLASVSRPDIAMAVSLLSRFYTCYTKEHFRYAMRVVRYFQEAVSLGIKYSRIGNELVVYSDSDFAGDYESCVTRTV